jgi:3',5'-cyclic AMP phosphodiesterase CpdA
MATLSPAPQAPPVALARHPYVQSCATDSVVIVWDTDVPGDSVVEYGITPGLGLTAQDPALVTQHAARLTGLEPGATYHYRVTSNGAVLASDTFRVSKTSSSEFSFAVLGDSGDGSSRQRMVASSMLARDPDLVLHTGDVVYDDGEAEDYDPKFFDIYRDLIASVCIFPSLGNHDYHTSRAQPYLDAFFLPANNSSQTERYYSFDYGDAHFVALDSNLEGAEFTAMKEWLAKDLASSARRWKFAFLHHALYSSGSKHGIDWRIREELSPIFEAHNVDMVFSGHEHNYERSLPRRDYVSTSKGVIYVVSGGGAGLYRVGKSDFTAHSASVNHFVWVRINGEKLTLEAVDASGTVFDAYDIDKTGQ